jgi:peroxiredoxin
MTAEPNALRVGDKAPEFAIATVDRETTLHRLAARYKQLVLTTQDSYRYHPN